MVSAKVHSREQQSRNPREAQPARVHVHQRRVAGVAVEIRVPAREAGGVFAGEASDRRVVWAGAVGVETRVGVKLPAGETPRKVRRGDGRGDNLLERVVLRVLLDGAGRIDQVADGALVIPQAPENVAGKDTKTLDRCILGSLRRLWQCFPLGVPLVFFWNLLASLLTARVFAFLLLTVCVSALLLDIRVGKELPP